MFKFQKGEHFVSSLPVLAESPVSPAPSFCSLEPDRHPQSHRKGLNNLLTTDVSRGKTNLLAYAPVSNRPSLNALLTGCNGRMSFSSVWLHFYLTVSTNFRKSSSRLSWKEATNF